MSITGKCMGRAYLYSINVSKFYVLFMVLVHLLCFTELNSIQRTECGSTAKWHGESHHHRVFIGVALPAPVPVHHSRMLFKLAQKEDP